MVNSRATSALQDMGVEYLSLSSPYNPNHADLAVETAMSLGISPEFLLKTLMIETTDGPIVALIIGRRGACRQHTTTRSDPRTIFRYRHVGNLWTDFWSQTGFK